MKDVIYPVLLEGRFSGYLKMMTIPKKYRTNDSPKVALIPPPYKKNYKTVLMLLKGGLICHIDE